MLIRLADYFPSPPDAIKMDVEGFELSIIQSDPDFFSAVSRLAIEIHSEYLPEGGAHSIAELLGPATTGPFKESGLLRL